MFLPLQLAPSLHDTLADLRGLIPGYRELRTARWQAQDRGLDPCENPLPLLRLQEQGLAEHLIILMLYHGHVVWLPPGGGQTNRRMGEAAGRPRLLPGSLFALTEAGEDFADTLLADSPAPGEEVALGPFWCRFCPARLVPRYDKDNRVFRWGSHPLKCFRQPSVNQELILLAAEELSWPDWFDDPLPKRPGTNPKVRLHDTIKDLNRRQTPHLVRFKGDGTGTRVGWECC